MNALLSWIRANPQKTTGVIAQATGYLMITAPTLITNVRALAAVVAFFGLLQTVFGFLAKPEPAPPQGS